MLSAEKNSIIYIANARFPNEKAHGIQFTKTCVSLIDQGINLELLLPNRKTKIKKDPFEYYGIKEKFSYKKIWTVNILPKTTFGYLLSSFVFGVTSFFYIFKKKNSIIYSIDLDPLSFLGIIFSRQPYFFEIHGPKKNTFLNRLLFKNIKGIIAVSEAIKEDLTENFTFLKDKIIVCPNGVDLEEDKGISKDLARQKLNLDKDKNSIVYTGSFQDWKGVEIILEAAKDLKDTDFYFVGGSKNDITWVNNKESLPNNLRFIGMRDHKEMPLWRAAADALITTGTKKDRYSYLYTSPMKLFEYMAAKRPIIASRTPAIEKIVSDREVFFHDPDNPDDLKEKIEYVLKNPEEAGKKSESSYIKAKEYTWENRAKKILNFINIKL